MLDQMTLLPPLQRISVSSETFRLPTGTFIELSGIQPSELVFSARRLQHTLAHAECACPIAVGNTTDASSPTIQLIVDPAKVGKPGAYQISIGPDGVRVKADQPAGIFYGVCTLIQLVEQSGTTLPCLEITDWPDYHARGVMLDISRDKVPTLETLRGLIDLLAGWKVNQLQLYTEHTFAYRHHPDVWAAASPITGEEILELDAFCRERFIELVPNQNLFGHMERWFVHPRYRPLSEFPDGALTVTQAPEFWHLAPQTYGQTLCPGDPRSLDLVRSMLDELLPHFSSKMLNVNCDETFDLLGTRRGVRGRSRDLSDRIGVGRVYLDFLIQVYEEVSSRGFTMQFWGDIIAQHPELVPALPRDAIALEWGYDADHPFAMIGQRYAEAQIPFYVCPGTSSWGTIAGRTTNAIDNIRNAANAGREHGALGHLNTDWGEDGHRQFLPVSFLGFAVGAAEAWIATSADNLDVPRALNVHAFRDRNGIMGPLAYTLGNACAHHDLMTRNATIPGLILRYSIRQMRDPAFRFHGLLMNDRQRFADVCDAVAEILAPLQTAAMDRADAALIIDEYRLTGQLLQHACRRALLVVADDADARAAAPALAEDLRTFIDDYRSVWLARNRQGGLQSSIARLEALRDEYLAMAG